MLPMRMLFFRLSATLVSAAAMTTMAGAAPAPGLAALAAPPVTFTILQLRTRTLPPEVTQKLAPLHTLDDVEAVLKDNFVSFAWSRGEVSSDTMNPQLLQQFNALPAKEVFVLPQADGIVIGQIVGRR